VAELADRKGVPVVAGHLLLFHPAVVRLREMLDAGDLGQIFYLYSQRVNLGQVRPDENALWSFGPHDVSVARFLLGARPATVGARGHSYLQPGIEDVVFLTLEFASGASAHVQMSWLDPHKERRLTVVGSKRMVVFDDMQPREKLKIFDKGVDRPPEYRSYGESLSVREGDIFIPRIPNAEPLTAELRHFVAVARGEEQSRVTAWDGVEVVEILEVASESLRSDGRAIALGAGRPS
jgi:predicted dehydrogenase